VTSTSPSSSRAARGALGALIAFALFAGCAEGFVRALRPTPRGQIARLSDDAYGMTVRDHAGVPLWEPQDPSWLALRDPPCLAADPATTTTLALAGDSVLYVTGGGDAHENVGWYLQQRLDELAPGRFCVVNTAAFAYSAAQKRAALQELYAKAQVDRVIWEVWGEAPTYRRIGDDVYAIGSYLQDEQGYPYIGWVPLPAALNRALFTHSRAWEYAVIALGAEAVEDDVRPYHAGALDDAAAEGAAFSFFFFPDLGAPFRDPPTIQHATHPALHRLIAERGAEEVDMRAMMVDQDHLAIRLNPCCHYNPRGHAAVAAKLADWVLARP
jgi:hypothetical protein